MPPFLGSADNAVMIKLKRPDRPLTERTNAAAAGTGQRPIVSVRGLVKTYRTGDVAVEALRGVDLDISPGQFVVIMGPSGNGKTTLLNCSSGIDDIDTGQVLIDGEDIGAMSDRARTAHRAETMGFVFQSFNLIPVLTAAENCELPLLTAGVKAARARRRALDLLDRVGLAAGQCVGDWIGAVQSGGPAVRGNMGSGRGSGDADHAMPCRVNRVV